MSRKGGAVWDDGTILIACGLPLEETVVVRVRGVYLHVTNFSAIVLLPKLAS